MIDLNAIISEFVTPEKKEGFVKKLIKTKLEKEHRLKESFNNGVKAKDLLKTTGWNDIVAPKIKDTLKKGIGTLIRNGLSMNESELKTVIAEMRTSLRMVADIRYMIENGHSAGKRLEKVGKNEVKN